MSLFKIKRGYNSLSKTFRLPIELVEKLEQLATENNISLNQLIIQCLEYAMDNLGKESEKEHQSH
ncbi:MAG: toxin-antitoxin system HicB family antitoxin [Flexilinea sp.]